MVILLLTLLFSYPDSARVIGRMYYGGSIGENWGSRVIVRDSLQNIHFVYSKKWGVPYADSSEIFYRYSADNGNTWSQEVNISRTDSLVSTEPCLVIDKNDMLHCFWKQYVPNGIGCYEIFHCQKDSTGWNTPTRLTYQNTTTNARNHSATVVDSLNCIRLVWDAPPDNIQPSEIWYSILTDTGLTLPFNVTASPTASGGPSLGIDSLDFLHITYYEYMGSISKEYYKKYDNISWSPPYYLAWQLDGEGGADLVVDSKNRLHCFLSHILPAQTQADIYYLCYTDTGGWSYPLNISETPTTSSWRLATACDSFDNLYVVWQEKLSGYTDDIYYRTFNGATWSSVINLTNDPNLSSIPKLGHPVTSNGVDLIWQHRISSYPPVYDVVYMRLQPVASGIEEPELSKLIPNKPPPTMKIFPNPTKSFSNIHYSLPFASKVSLQLYGISGRLVKTLIDERKQPGNYSSTLNTKTLSSGVYFLSLQTEKKTIIERVVIVK